MRTQHFGVVFCQQGGRRQGRAVIQDRGFHPVGLDRDGHLHRLTLSRSIQDRIRRRLVDGKDDLLGDLARHVAQAGSSCAPETGKVGRGRGNRQLHRRHPVRAAPVRLRNWMLPRDRSSLTRASPQRVGQGGLEADRLLPPTPTIRQQSIISITPLCGIGV